MRRELPIRLARIRTPVLVAGLLLTALALWLFDGGPLSLAGFLLMMVSLVSLFLPVGYVRSTAVAPGHPAAREPVVVIPPVRGRWISVNSPADKIPSHGVHAYGQTHAIDLVHEPADGVPWKPLGSWPPRRPEEFAAFGEPILTPADGTVVRVHDRERDHLSRDSVPGVLYVFIEGMVRELTGPSRILGNHVILDLGNGAYAALAHLRRGSVRVAKGQRVTAGEQLAECGNSGNSSEPHLHFQLMDHRNVLVAAGLPFVFDRYESDDGGTVHHGVPGGQRVFSCDDRAAEAHDQRRTTNAS
ncbi:MAG: M23 family metallopeptidase [Actinomadura sp.]